MMINSIIYLFHETWLSIKSNRIPNITAVTTTAIALSLFGLFLLLFINFNSVIDSFEEKLNVVIYLKDGLKESEVQDIRSFLGSQKEIDTISFLSKDKALEEFKKRIGSHQAIFEGLDTNPLPASFVVTFKKDFKNSGFTRDFVKNVQALNGVEDVEYGKDWVEKFESFAYLAQMVILVLGGLLGLASILIIYNTIKLTVYSRKEEIEIMRLVGATHRFIKGPFILNGIIQAGLGAFLSLIILWILYKTFIVQITVPLGNLIGMKQIFFINRDEMLAFIAVALLLGVIGSFLAVGRVLKI